MPKHLIMAVTVACAVSAFATPALAQDGISCSKLIADTENRRQIPRGLLMAIAVTESGMNGIPNQIGRAHVCTPVNNALLVCRLLLEKTKNKTCSTIIKLP